MDKSSATTKYWGSGRERRSSTDIWACAAVAALHLAFVLLLVRDRLPAAQPARPAILLTMVSEPRRPPPVPPPRMSPVLTSPAASVPVPQITVAEAKAASPPHPPARAPAPATAPAAAGLDMDVTASGGGGGSARAALEDFQAQVRARIAAARRQPVLARDLRNTCLINYTVSIDRAGHLAGVHIDQCTVAALNQAARDAIARAGPFAPPPDLGATRTQVHGSLVFEP